MSDYSVAAAEAPRIALTGHRYPAMTDAKAVVANLQYLCYRFKEEEGDDKVQCKCGAPNCRGTLN